MGDVFSGNEIVEMAIEIERNGRDFYQALADKSGDVCIKEVFKILAREEEKHIAVFENMFTNRQEISMQAYADDYLNYMKTLVDEYVFTQKDKGKDIAKSIKSQQEALQLGIDAEKDSIVFYEGIKEVVAKNDIEAVDNLIKEEQRHLNRLLALKKKISRKEKE